MMRTGQVIRESRYVVSGTSESRKLPDGNQLADVVLVDIRSYYHYEVVEGVIGRASSLLQATLLLNCVYLVPAVHFLLSHIID